MLQKFTVKALGICNGFSRDEEGAFLVECALLTALIAVAVGAAVITFGTSLSTGWNTLETYASTLFTSSCGQLKC